MSIYQDVNNVDLEQFFEWERVTYRQIKSKQGELNLKSCPNCQDNRYKIFINNDRNRGICHHCGTIYSKYSLIKEISGIEKFKNLEEYIYTLLERQGVRRKKVIHKQEISNNFELPESVEIPYQGRNLTYLKNRLINNEISEYFSLRYCKAGKYVTKNEDGEFIQDFSGRVIIPIYNLEGRLVSFQGRDITGLAEKRYMFPSGLPSSNYLYNGHNAVGKKEIVICEGVFDVMAVTNAIWANCDNSIEAVGSFGKALTKGDSTSQFAELLKLKAQGLEKITFLWDGERQATFSAVKYGNQLRKLGFQVYIGILPDTKDPSDATKIETLLAIQNATKLTDLSMIEILQKVENYEK